MNTPDDGNFYSDAFLSFKTFVMTLKRDMLGLRLLNFYVIRFMTVIQEGSFNNKCVL